MSRFITIFVSIILIIAGVIIEILLKDSTTKLDVEIIEFFAGILFGTGIFLPISLFWKKKKQ